MVNARNFNPMVEFFDPFKEPFSGKASVAFASSGDIETCSACSACTACSACASACTACSACGSWN